MVTKMESKWTRKKSGFSVSLIASVCSKGMSNPSTILGYHHIGRFIQQYQLKSRLKGHQMPLMEDDPYSHYSST